MVALVWDGAEARVRDMAIDEGTGIGSRCGEFPPAITALAGGEVKVTPLAEATFPLRAALATIRRPAALKILLAPGS